MCKNRCGRALSTLLLDQHTWKTPDTDRPDVLLLEGTAFYMRYGSSVIPSLELTLLCSGLSLLTCCLSFGLGMYRCTCGVLLLHCATFSCYATPKKWWKMECNNFSTEKKTWKGEARTLWVCHCTSWVLLHNSVNFSCYATAKKWWKMECSNFSTEKKTWMGAAWTLKH